MGNKKSDLENYMDTAKYLETAQIEYLQNIKDHYTPKWEVILKHLDTIQSPLEKIEHLKKQELKYMAEVVKTPVVLNSSGTHIANTYPHKIGMDALIDLEIKKIQLEFGLRDNPVKLKSNKEAEPTNSFKLDSVNKESFKDVLDKLQPHFIAKNVTVLNFKKIFSGKTISPNDKIEWLGTLASLHYFIGEIDKNQNQSKKWITACNCFYKNGFSITSKNLVNNKDVSKKDKATLISAIKQFNFLPLQ